MRLALLSLVAVLAACDSSLSVLGGLQPRARVQEIDRYVASPSETLGVTGLSLDETIEAVLDDKPVLFVLIDSAHASIQLPDAFEAKQLKLEFWKGNRSIGRFPLVNAKYLDNLPVNALADDVICSDVLFLDANGEVRAGTRSCSETLEECGQDGQIDCKAIEAFPSVDKNQLLAGNLRSGVVIAGVIGAYPSAEHPLADSDPDLESLPVLAATVGGESYEWFQADGTRVTGSIEADVTLNPGASSQTLNAGLYRNLTVNGDANLIPGNLRDGVTIFGVLGNIMGAAPPDCSTDGEVACIAVSDFPAVDKLTKLLSAHIKNGVSIAGVSGEYPSNTYPLTGASVMADLPLFASTAAGQSYEWFSSDGTRLNGTIEADISAGSTTSNQVFSNGLYRQVTVTGDADLVAANIITGTNILGVEGTNAGEIHTDCVTDDSTGCVANSLFKAVEASKLTASVVKSGFAVGGITGDYPSAANPLAGSTVTDDLGAFADAVGGGTYEWFNSEGTRFGGSIQANVTAGSTIADQVFSSGLYRQVTVTGDADLVAANIITGTNILGIEGAATIETHTPCAASGVTGCVTTTDATSLLKTDLSPGILKKSTVLVGITGDYPSTTYRLDGSTGTKDLTSASFWTDLKSSASFEYFDSAGNLHTDTGSALLTAENIRNDIVFFGETGTYGTECQADAEVGCVTTTQFKAADTDLYDSWDLRSGKIVGGVVGSFKIYNSGSKLSLFNRITGDGHDTSTSAPDAYDSIEDFNNGSTMPVQVRAGWSLPDIATQWVRDSASDTNSNGTCDGAEHCIYLDQSTKLRWAKVVTTSRSWEGAITYCEGLNYGGQEDWRLPSQKELMMAYINGIWGLKTPLNIAANFYWSSTTRSEATTEAWGASIQYGNIWNTAKSGSFLTICVRE